MKNLARIGESWIWVISGVWVVTSWINGLAPWLAWLGWVPNFGFVLLALPGVLVLAVAKPQAKVRFVRVAAPLICLMGAALLTDFRPWLTRTPEHPEHVLRVAFINAAHPLPERSAVAAQRIIDLNADIVLITDPAVLHGDLEALANGPRVAGTFKVSAVSGLQITSFTTVYASSSVNAVAVSVVGPTQQEFRMLVVDMPSTGDRIQVAGTLRAILSPEVGPRWDLVVGDFNMTPRSRTLEWATEGYANVFEEEGVGWGATWPGDWPLIRIDHGFVLDADTVRRVETFDAGVDHRGLLITLELPSV